MNPTKIEVQLDSQDALLRDCVEGRLPFIDFLAAYGDFPRGSDLEKDAGVAGEGDVLRLFRKRVAFHRTVASLLAGLRATGYAGSLTGEIAEILPTVGLMRLRQLVARYPKFEATSGERGITVA
jgi:hypothetical protein